MSNRRFDILGIRVATALALLVGVMSSPMRPARTAVGSARPHCLRDNVSLPTSQSWPVSVTSVGSRPFQIKALASEGEEELKAATAPSCDSIDPPPLPSSKPPRDLTAFDPVRAPYPLRC